MYVYIYAHIICICNCNTHPLACGLAGMGSGICEGVTVHLMGALLEGSSVAMSRVISTLNTDI